MRNFLISIFVLVIPLENLFSNNWIEDIYLKFQKKYIVSASFYYNAYDESDLLSLSIKTYKNYYLVDIFLNLIAVTLLLKLT